MTMGPVLPLIVTDTNVFWSHWLQQVRPNGFQVSSFKDALAIYLPDMRTSIDKAALISPVQKIYIYKDKFNMP